MSILKYKDKTTGEWLPVSGNGSSGSSASIDVTAEVGQTIVVEEVDENGKPTKWKAMDFPEAEQADWNASEGEPGHVLNRTHYEEKDATIVVAERELTFSNNMAMVQEIFPIVPGEVYTVYFDGVPYKCRCRESAYGGAHCYSLGNDYIVSAGVNTGEPFLIGIISAYSMSGMFVADTEPTHTLKITQGNIYPLDSRYYNNTFCINLVDAGNNGYGIRESAEEIIKAHQNGMNLVCKYRAELFQNSLSTFFETYFDLRYKEFVADASNVFMSLEFAGVYSGSTTNATLVRSVKIAINMQACTIESIAVTGGSVENLSNPDI